MIEKFQASHVSMMRKCLINERLCVVPYSYGLWIFKIQINNWFLILHYSWGLRFLSWLSYEQNMIKFGNCISLDSHFIDIINKADFLLQEVSVQLIPELNDLNM